MEKVFEVYQISIARKESNNTSSNISYSTSLVTVTVEASKDNIESTVVEIIDLDSKVLKINNKIQRDVASKRSNTTI